QHNADIRFGLSNPRGWDNAEHFFTQSNQSELRLGFQVSAQVTLRPTLDLRVLYISLAGLEANFGKGLRTGPGFFMLCHSETGSRCAVLERFWVKELTVKGLFGLFDYTHMFRTPPEVTLFFYDGTWYRQCPHSGEYAPYAPAPAESGFTIEHFPFWDIITLYSGYIKFIADPHETVTFDFSVISDGLGVNYFWTDYDSDNRLNNDLSISSRGGRLGFFPGQVIMMGMFDENGPPVQIEFWGGMPNVGIQAYEGPLFHRVVVPPQGSATFRNHSSLTFSVQNPYWIIRERRETDVFMITAVNLAALEPVTESSRYRAAFAVRPYDLGHSTIITNPLPMPIEFFVPYAWILAGAMSVEIRN
ncbi:MAG: hypothetical protein LBE35_03045, partial [Clostridiales bacterium]|nr:hypothetical protein [Clostridiales bacterium]